MTEQDAIKMALDAGLSPKSAQMIWQAARELHRDARLSLDKCVVTIIAAEVAAKSGGPKR